MPLPRRALAAAVVLLSLVGAVCCSRPEPSGAKPAEPAVASQPSPAEVKADMGDHFTRVKTIEEAVIRGDLDDAREPATWLADHQESAGFASNLRSRVDELKGSAKSVAVARDIWGASQATAAMVATCGACHVAANVKPVLPPVPTPPTIAAGLPGYMLAHQRAVDLMYQGLIAPSDGAWKGGAAELKRAPLTLADLPKDPLLTKEVAALEGDIVTMAGRADAASDTSARVAIYGEIIAACANCHVLHGDIWGPGLPKK